jgi:chitinase
VLISLGGWTWSKNFSTFAATDASRKALVSSCIDIYLKGNLPVDQGAGGTGVAKGVFDGIDIDWEYPVAGGLGTNAYSAADKQNYTLLMAEFHSQLNALTTANKRRYYLTAAIGSGVDKIRNTEPALYSTYLDWINVMSYDFHGGWEAAGPTNFQSALYGDAAAPVTGDLTKYNVNDAVSALVAAGMPKNKIVVGVPFYGRGWKGVTAGAKGDGLYQKATSPAAGTYEAGVDDYKVLVAKRSTRYVHPITKQLWMYDGNEFWSYDDPAVIATKSAYVKDQGLGGLFSWSLDGDDSAGTLLKAMNAVRQ